MRDNDVGHLKKGRGSWVVVAFSVVLIFVILSGWWIFPRADSDLPRDTDKDLDTTARVPILIGVGGGVLLTLLLGGMLVLVSRLSETGSRAQRAALLESEERHRLLFEQSHDAIMILTPPSWRFASGNPAACKMFGASDQAEFTALGPWDVSPEYQPDGGSSAAQAKAAIETALREGSHFFEWTHRRIDGADFPATVLLTRMQVAGQTFVQATVRNISDQKQTEKTLARTVETLRTERDLFSAGPVFTVVWGASEHWPVQQISSNIANILGYPVSEMMDPAFRYAGLIHPDDLARVVAEVKEHVDNHEDSFEQSYRLKTNSGDYRWFYDFSMLTRNPSGAVECIRGYLFDQTRIKEAEIALDQERQRLAGILRGTRAGTWEWDVRTGEVIFNERWAEIIGYTLEELAPLSIDTWEACSHPDDLKVSRLLLARHFRGELDYYECELRVKHKDGSWVWVQDRGKVATWTDDGKPGLMQGTHQDITTLKEHQRQLENIAHYDALTTLPNRVLLANRLHQAIAKSQRHGQRMAVAYLDLDGFKVINDNHGHSVGDQFLITVATRMKQTLREGDTLARLGGDEFVAVLVDVPDIEACVSLLTRLLDAVAEPVRVGETIHRATVSLGVTFYPQTEEVDADQLLRQADQSMYQAKLAGKNRYHIFDAEHDRSARGHHESLEHIRRALIEHEFELYYQPKVNMRTGKVVGAEALIRWRHPELGLLSPAVFLPVIEDHPLAVELGEWVIEAALIQMEEWRRVGLDLPVSVNIGARQLQHVDFVKRLRKLLAAHPDIQPSCLGLEVLETSALEDLALVSQVISACRELGVLCALDDFGTGYSSLTYLKRLPVTQLKVDQSFVRDMLEDPEDLAIVESVLGLARAFGRQAIAEGVETVDHGEILLQLGCELAQGYGIARPMPAQAIPDWLAAWRPDPRWIDLPMASRSDLPLLYIGVEHRAWIASIEHRLKGEASPPLLSLDQQQCRFAVWLKAEGLAGHGQESTLQRIDGLHQQVHALALELLELHSRGSLPEALTRLGELHDLGERLLEQLRRLIRERGARRIFKRFAKTGLAEKR